jgi:16S rRNA (guanine527-N7)-methyltransferase
MMSALEAAAGVAPEDADLAGTLGSGLDRLGLQLPQVAHRKLLDYLALLGRWNRTYNLTAIREPRRMVTHHLLDSLAVLPALDLLAGARTAPRLLDVGSGGGLPGIPIAIARPAWRVTLVEPVQKKGAFLVQAIAELGLANADAAIVRVEDLATDAPFDIVISRAFSNLADFAHAARRQVTGNGRLVAMKGAHPDAELARLPAEVAVDAVAALAVPFIEGARHLVVMRRRSDTAAPRIGVP